MEREMSEGRLFVFIGAWQILSARSQLSYALSKYDRFLQRFRVFGVRLQHILTVVYRKWTFMWRVWLLLRTFESSLLSIHSLAMPLPPFPPFLPPSFPLSLPASLPPIFLFLPTFISSVPWPCYCPFRVLPLSLSLSFSPASPPSSIAPIFPTFLSLSLFSPVSLSRLPPSLFSSVPPLLPLFGTIPPPPFLPPSLSVSPPSDPCLSIRDAYGDSRSGTTDMLLKENRKGND
eukprot:6205140-Pleurochrysis_carterae.AAC.1